MIGDRLMALARAWFDDTTVERVFEPLIADWQRECSSISGSRALICRMQGHLAFATTFLMTFGRDSRRPLPVGLGGAAWLCVDAFAALGALVLVYLWHLSGNPRGTVGMLLPSQLTIALPIAVAPACIVLLNSRWQPFEARRAILRVVTISVVVMMVLSGWIVPSANQRFRESVAAAQSSSEGRSNRPVRRGMRELTLPELWASAAPREPLVAGDHGRSLEFHNRLSVILMPFCMMAVGIAASRGRRSKTLRCLAWWVVCASVWFLAASVASARIAAAGVEEPLLAWTPTATMLILAAVAKWISTRAPGEWTLPRWGSTT